MARDTDIEREAETVEDPGEPRIPPPVDDEETQENEGAQEGEDPELPEGSVILYDENGQAYLGIPIDTENEEEEVPE